MSDLHSREWIEAVIADGISASKTMYPSKRMHEHARRVMQYLEDAEFEIVPCQLIWDAYQAVGRRIDTWTDEDRRVADRLGALMVEPESALAARSDGPPADEGE